MKRIILIVALFLCAGSAFGQPRPVDRSSKPAASAPSNPAPLAFEAKYEGGMFGFNSKEVGFLKFDDDNERLVFLGKDQNEKFHLP